MADWGYTHAPWTASSAPGTYRSHVGSYTTVDHIFCWPATILEAGITVHGHHWLATPTPSPHAVLEGTLAVLPPPIPPLQPPPARPSCRPTRVRLTEEQQSAYRETNWATLAQQTAEAARAGASPQALQDLLEQAVHHRLEVCC